MRCPYCRADQDRVVDSRAVNDGAAIRRRRVCSVCDKRYTTYERPEVAPRMVVKKDGSRAAFSRDKILRGMITACEKRHISLEQLNETVDRIESELFDGNEREVQTSLIGEKVSESLRELDEVAYVRFTSVYREFRDVREFLEALAPLLAKDEQNEPCSDAGRPPPRVGSAEELRIDLSRYGSARELKAGGRLAD